MRCCANCEWSISPELEYEIMEEQGYKEADLNRPHAGDCCIGMKHDENYSCSAHVYINGIEENNNSLIEDVNTIKQRIIEESRHQFIYGYNNEFRKKFLKNLEKEYSIIINNDFPMAIYLDEYGLPFQKTNNTQIDKIRLYSLSREYLYCNITYKILENILSNIDKNELSSRINILLSNINKLYLNHNYPEIVSLEELIEVLKETRKTYYNYYQQYLEGSAKKLEINKLKLPFLDLDWVINYIKKMLNNHSYFCIIIDHVQDIAISSVQTINSLVNSRNNANISIKIACEPNEWPTYLDLNGQYIDYIHDYAELNLDDSYIKKGKGTILKKENK